MIRTYGLHGGVMKKTRLFLFTFVLGLSALFTCFLYQEGQPTATFKEAFGLNQRNLFSTNTESTPPRDKRTVIFLISSKRSGSSFVGEYFNKHPEIFYIFEPLQSLTFNVLEGKTNNSAFDETAMDILKGLVDCRFDRGLKSPKEWLTRRSPICVFNEELGESAVCSKDYNYNETEIGELLTDTCWTKPDIAFKIIRIQDLEMIQPFILNPKLNTKVLYLIRDPRGTMNSRTGIEMNFDLLRRTKNMSLEVDDMCDTMERNLMYSINTPLWLRGRLMLLRYEDVALYPLDLGKEIFQFIGRDFDLEVIKWLFLSTRNIETDEDKKEKHFRTSRESAARVSGWRKEMTWDRILSIQDKCKNAMRIAGYLPISSETFLKNFSFPSLQAYRPEEI